MPERTPSELIREALAEDPNWLYGQMLPVAKNKTSGEYSAALPGFLRDYLMGLGDLITPPRPGDNMTPQAVMSILGPGSSEGKSVVIGPGAKTFDAAKAFVNPLFQGDRIPRNAIDDSLARLAPMGELTESAPGSPMPAYLLKDIFDHPELFEAYPDLRELIVGLPQNMKSKAYGYFDPNSDQIILNPKLSDEDSTGILLHEIQHAIQQRENFNKGNNPSNFLPRDFQRVRNTVYDWLQNPNPESSAVHQANIMQAGKDVYKMEKTAQRYYQRIPGEAEARAVQHAYNNGRPMRPTFEEGPNGWFSVDTRIEAPYPELPFPYNYLDLPPTNTAAFDPANRQRYTPSLAILSKMLNDSLAGGSK